MDGVRNSDGSNPRNATSKRGSAAPRSGGMISRQAASMLLRETGSRMTAQRNAVLELLEGNRTHPTADSIIAGVQERLGFVSPATIYNTLESLEQLGLVRRIDGLETKAHFDPDTSDHQHAICRRCKRVFDVGLGRIEVPGFSIDDVVIHGLCDECKASGNPA